LKTSRKALTVSLLTLFAISALGTTPIVNAFTFGSQYGAFASTAAASDYYGIYNSDTSPSPGDGSTTASADSTASDSAGGSASANGAVDVVSHTLTGAASADCAGSDDCYDTYYGGYYGVGGSEGSNMYDTYTFSCASCGYIDVSVSYTITGSFEALDNGPVCQGTANPETLSAVACESLIEPRIQIGSFVCGGVGAKNYCPPAIIDYAQGWNFCQTGPYYQYYCPFSTSFTVSGTADISSVMQSEGYPFSSAYLAPGASEQIQFTLGSSSNVDLPGSESESASVQFSVTSATPGVTITSAACGCSTTSPGAPTTTTVQVGSRSDTVGNPVSVKAIVSGTSPTGTVSWSSSGPGTFSPTSCTLSNVECSVDYTPTSASGSPVTISAWYGGDSSNLASSGNGTLTVDKAYTSTAVNCLPGSIDASGSSTCTASVSGGSSPTGTVSFGSSSATGSFSPSASCTLSSGTCSVSYSDTASGSPTITGTYSGDSGNYGSIGYGSVTVTGLSVTNTAVSCSPQSVAIGAPSDCTATVTGSSPTGTVNWSSSGSGTFSSDACSLSDGTCSVTYAPSAAGGATINASYGGDTNNAGSSGTFALSTAGSGKDKTHTSVSCNPSPDTVNEAITCTITVTDTGSSPTTPTGRVAVLLSMDPGFPALQTCSLSGIGVDDVATGNSASCTVTFTPRSTGTLIVLGAYLGDSTHLVSTGTTRVAVNPASS
jgi:hypothetical protein